MLLLAAQFEHHRANGLAPNARLAAEIVLHHSTQLLLEKLNLKMLIKVFKKHPKAYLELFTVVMETEVRSAQGDDAAGRLEVTVGRFGIAGSGSCGQLALPLP